VCTQDVQGRTAVVSCAYFSGLKAAVVAFLAFARVTAGMDEWDDLSILQGREEGSEGACSERCLSLANGGKILICVYTVTDILPASGSGSLSCA